MFICGQRRLSIRDEGGLATRDGTHLSPFCKIRVENAHWTRRLGVEDRMRLLPPPQFFQRLEKTNITACTIQRAFRRAQRAHAVACIVAQHAPQDQVPTIPVLSLSPLTASFPIGCRIIVASSHLQHANTYGVVTRHTTKFVIFAPKNCSQESICILPMSLILAPPLATPSPPPCRDEARTQDRTAISDDAEEDQTRTHGQQEQDNISYDALPETANFPVSDGYVSFTRTF